MKDTSQLLKEASKCVRCGTCKSVCPSYNVLRREGASPRGRVTLVEARLSGAEGFTEEYLRDIKNCTLCASCYHNCPQGVNVPELVIAGRAEYAKVEGMPLAASMIFKNVLNSEFVMSWALRIASKFQGLFLKESTVQNGLLSRFSLPLIGGGRLLPELPGEFFLDSERAKRLSPSNKNKQKAIGAPKVAFYAGCGVNFLLPKIGESTLDALERAGADVYVPDHQLCCGMPALSSGDVDTAKELALKNIEAFEAEKYDYIVTSCATCGHALKSVFMELLGDKGPVMRARVENFSSKVRDITELLAGELAIKKRDVSPGKDKKVAYHDPCHLRRYQGIVDEPRELIKLSGAEYTKMKNPCKCCGLGGGLAFTNYELSAEISKVKARSVKDSGAEVVATACPGCIIQLKDALNREGVKAEVVHVVELL